MAGGLDVYALGVSIEHLCVCVCATACMHVHLSVSKLKSYVDEFTVNFHFNTVILVYP